MHFQIPDRRRKHWGMFSLQSDFSRHSLTKLLGAAELRMFIFSYTSVILSHPQATPIDQTVLNQSSRPTPSASLQVWLGKAGLGWVGVFRCRSIHPPMLLYHHGFGNGYINTLCLVYPLGLTYNEMKRTEINRLEKTVRIWVRVWPFLV
jgi:hypothetical protein